VTRYILLLLSLYFGGVYAEVHISQMEAGPHLSVTGVIPTELTDDPGVLMGIIALLERTTGTVIPDHVHYKLYLVRLGSEQDLYAPLARLQEAWTRTHLCGKHRAAIATPGWFDGYDYTGTPYLQVDHTAFETHTSLLPNGPAGAFAGARAPYPMTVHIKGYGLYLIAHELLHKFLSLMGIPVSLHHGVMVERGYLDVVVGQLVAHNLADGRLTALWSTQLKPQLSELSWSAPACRKD
jgi:hypothetical protein